MNNLIGKQVTESDIEAFNYSTKEVSQYHDNTIELECYSEGYGLRITENVVQDIYIYYEGDVDYTGKYNGEIWNGIKNIDELLNALPEPVSITKGGHSFGIYDGPTYKYDFGNYCLFIEFEEDLKTLRKISLSLKTEGM